MALSLDYIGRYVIIIVALAVATSLIIGFSGDVKGMIPGLNPTDDGDTDAEVVDVAATSTSGQAEELARLAQLCYDRYLENPQEGFTCFVARAESGSFSITSASTITNKIDGEAKAMTEVSTPLNKATAVVKYSLARNKIVITD